MKDYTKLDQEVEALADAIWDVAFKVWEFAELGYQEFKSSAYEAEALEKAGFIISDRGSGAPVLGYLVEFDALPGLGKTLVNLARSKPC